MRVALFVEPSPISHVSGMKIRFENLIDQFVAQGDEVLLVTPDAAPPAQFRGAKVLAVLGFQLQALSDNYSSPTLLLTSGLSVRLFWELLTHRPDVMHVTLPGTQAYIITIYARLLNIPLVMSYHTHIPEYMRRYNFKEDQVDCMWAVNRWCTEQADHFMTPSQVLKDEFLARGCGTEDQLSVWRRAVQTERFHPRYRSAEMAKRMTGGAGAACIMVYVGRLGVEKNLKSLKPILEQNPTVHLTLVGDGPSRPALEAHYAGLPVTFMGLLQGEELSSAYASADIFIMPSETETLGFVVLEAMASGLAVVAAAAGGVKDIVSRPGVNGYLYPPGDEQHAAELVSTLVRQPEQRALVAAAARAEAESWSWEASIAQIRNVQYATAISRHRQTRAAHFEQMGSAHAAWELLVCLWTLALVLISFVIKVILRGPTSYCKA